MKPLISITAAIIAAASTMSHGSISVNVSTDKQSESARSNVKGMLEKHDLSSIMDSNLRALSTSMKLDYKPLSINMKELLAAAEGADSTTQNLYNPATTGCYSNCYSNCHGSRSWR